MTDRSLEQIIDELSERFLGRFGIVTIGDGDVGGTPVVVVFVAGSTDDAKRALPPEIDGVPIVIQAGGNVTTQ